MQCRPAVLQIERDLRFNSKAGWHLGNLSLRLSHLPSDSCCLGLRPWKEDIPRPPCGWSKQPRPSATNRQRPARPLGNRPRQAAGPLTVPPWRLPRRVLKKEKKKRTERHKERGCEVCINASGASLRVNGARSPILQKSCLSPSSHRQTAESLQESRKAFSQNEP
jgi:hypothetical protein